MAAATLHRVLRQVRRLVGVDAVDDLDDGRLLDRFAGQRDEDAFAELLRRHGPMVLNVGRRVLRDENDAEDVFQAAFLVLSRKATSLASCPSVGGWLYTVAYHLALRSRAQLARRPVGRPSEEIDAMPAPHDAAASDVSSLLDEELHRLPRAYRDPLVLCCLEGLSREEAARQLGWSPGALKGRLERGRDLLRSRLVARGVAPASLALAALVEPATSVATSPALGNTIHLDLARRTLESALNFVHTNPSASAGPASAHAILLAEGALHVMAMHRVKIAASLVASLALFGGIASTLWSNQGESKGAAAPLAGEKPAHSVADRSPDALPDGAAARLGTNRFRHPTRVVFAALTDSDKRLVTADADDVVRVWEVETGSIVRQFAVTSFAKKPDGVIDAGGMMIVGGRGAGIVVPRTAMSLAPDGKTLAVVDSRRTLRFWDITSGKSIRDWKPEKEQVTTLAYSHDGRRLAGLLGNGAVAVWDADNGDRLATCQRSKDDLGTTVRLALGLGASSAPTIAFAPDGKSLALAISERSDDADLAKKLTGVFLFDAETGKLRTKIDEAVGDDLATVAFSPDGKKLAWSNENGKVWLYDLKESKVTGSFAASRGFPRDLAFTPASDALLVVSRRGEIKRFDLAGKETWKIDGDAPPAADDIANARIAFIGNFPEMKKTFNRTLAVSRDGRRIVRLREQAAECWQVANDVPTLALDGHASEIRGLARLDDGKTVATWSDDGIVRFWNLADGKSARVVRLPVAATRIAISPDGKRIGFASGAGKVTLWDAVKNESLREMKCQPRGVAGLAFSHDGTRLASRGASTDPKLLVWDVATGDEVANLGQVDAGNAAVVIDVDGEARSAGSPAPGIAFSPDDATLAVQDKDQVTLWNWKSGQKRGEVKLPARAVEGNGRAGLVIVGAAIANAEDGRPAPLAFSTDGRLLAIGSQGKFIVCETATGKVRHEISVGKDHVDALSFLPGKPIVAASGKASTSTLWDVASGKEIATFDGHAAAVRAITVSSDGRLLLTGSKDTTTLVWKLDAPRTRD